MNYDAPVNLRFDDTNPAKEEQQYVDSIKRDVEWLGYKWDEELYASDYFQQLYDWAIEFIKRGLAYVDSQSSEDMAQQKGTPTTPGTDSPFRNRSVEENFDLFIRMKNGEFGEGTHILRARIDMTCSCAILLCIEFFTSIIIAPATIGAFIPCMTGRMEKATTSSRSRIHSVHWSSCRTANCMTGFLTRFMMITK